MRAWPLALLGLGLWSAFAFADELRVTAPVQLKLGAGATAEILIDGPADLSDLVLSVNHGSLGPPRKTADGHFVARFSPPPQGFPSVAVIAAVATTAGARIHGWARLPLWGDARAALQGRPGAQVTLEIAGRAYGPIALDAQGKGSVVVAIPPGTRRGTYGDQELEFALPKVSLVHLVLEQPSARADRAQEIGVRLYVTTEKGEPQPTFTPVARPAEGTVGGFSPVAPGVFTAQWTLPPGAPREVDLTTWSRADPSQQASLAARLVAGPAASIELEVDAPAFQAGDVGARRFTARVFDSANYPTEGTPEFTTSFGVVGRAAQRALGTWSAELLLSSSFAGASRAVVTARVAGAPAAQASVALEPGPAATVRAVPRQLTLLADGLQFAEVRAEVVDAYGNRRADPLRATSAGGPLEAAEADPSRFRYRAQRRLRGGHDEVTIAAGSVSTRVPVELEPAASRVSAALRLGVVTNLGNATGPMLSADALVWPVTHFGVGLEAGYLYVRRDAPVSAGPLAGTRAVLDLHGVPLLATVAGRLQVSRRLWFHAAAGGGVAALGSTLGIDGFAPVGEGALAPAARLSIGFGLALARGEPFVQLEGAWLGPTRAGSFGPDLFTAGVAAGVRIDVL